jgi:hypothetical protein
MNHFMKLNKYWLSGMLSAALCISACDKEKDDVVMPLGADEFPQVIRFDDEGAGELEDEDKFSFELTLNDRVDPDGGELGGKVVPLANDVTVSFEVDEFEGFARLSDYLVDVSAFYEVDDCTTQDVDVQFDANTGKGTVKFPKGVEAVEIEFETEPGLFDDDELNTEDRKIVFILTGVSGDETVTYNPAVSFEYEVLDDEGIHGEWELDPKNAAQFAAFKQLFGLISEDVRNLDAADVESIVMSIEYDEVQVEIELVETETITECGDTETVNKVIEIEADIEELDTQILTGAIEFAEEIEQDDTTLKEFVYKGDYTIVGKQLTLVLEGEYDDDTVGPVTLVLEK